jgi:hypothetical protein
MSAGPHEFRRLSEIVGLRGDAERVEALRRHLDELAQGPAFRGSYRSQQFLRYVVEKALQGSVDALKERTIGIELFQRAPAYDTGEDAIVRVTASDVRRRLLQHYGRHGDHSPFRIQLPSGSYLPEIEYGSDPMPAAAAVAQAVAAAVVHDEVGQPAAAPKPETSKPRKVKPAMRLLALLIVGAMTLVLVLALIPVLVLGAGSFRAWRRPANGASLPPWTAIFRAGRATHLITSDPNIEQLEELTKSDISVSDYAARRYVPNVDSLSPAQRVFYSFYLHADNAAAVDTPLAVNIARLVPDNSRIDVRSARSLRVADLQTDDNLILLGSPRSDPWVQLFASQLDFRFVYRADLKQEMIRNVHPLTGEQAVYVPTARGFATGESFAILALVQIPHRTGKALLLAGADGEGTEAAGHLVTDRDHLLRALQFCGIQPGGPPPDFELLLRLRTMAGSPSTVDLAACHRLSSYRPG